LGLDLPLLYLGPPPYDAWRDAGSVHPQPSTWSRQIVGQKHTRPDGRLRRPACAPRGVANRIRAALAVKWRRLRLRLRHPPSSIQHGAGRRAARARACGAQYPGHACMCRCVRTCDGPREAALTRRDSFCRRYHPVGPWCVFSALGLSALRCAHRGTVLTFDREVELLWTLRRRLSVGKVLFFLVRVPPSKRDEWTAAYQHRRAESILYP
jgi:hypothetical protein